MATLTKVAGSNVGAMIDAQDTNSGGDVIHFSGKPLLLVFLNGHSAAVTVNFVPATAGQIKEGVGDFTAPTRTLAVTENDGVGAFLFTQANVGAYLNGSGQIAITYASHNAALKVRAIEVQ